jgi:formate dehydrogenase subunit gamma
VLDINKQINQSERLREALIKAGLDPSADYERAIEQTIGRLGDDDIQNIVNSLKPKTVETPTEISKVKTAEEFLRFNLLTRIQHGLMAISIVILIITGLPLKFHDAALSLWFMNLIGGINVSSVVHRIGATGLIFVGLFHLLYIAFNKEGRRDFMLLLPRWKDLMDWILMLKYYFGMTQKRARFGRFSYIEKFDYWAVYWGMVIMITSGSLLWFQNFSLKFVPKFVMDIATEAHSDEALLATLAIIIWHFYNVHFSPSKFPMSKVFITGKLTREEMEEEHPLELEEILKQQSKSKPIPKDKAK